MDLSRVCSRPVPRWAQQLDSLADVVSFGVAPGMILYQINQAVRHAGPNAAVEIGCLLAYAAFLILLLRGMPAGKIQPRYAAAIWFQRCAYARGGTLDRSFPLSFTIGYFNGAVRNCC